jgi:hypothetical protein
LKYKILTKRKKIYITPNKVIWTLILFALIPLTVKIFVFQNYEKTILETILFPVLIGAFGIGAFIKLVKMEMTKTLDGELIDEIEFHEDKIVFNEKPYFIEDIRKIEIITIDYIGKPITTSIYTTNFDSNRSNGTDNDLKITLNTGENIKIKFQQEFKNQILNEKNTLIKYSNLGKLNYLNLLSILNITEHKEIQEFKRNNLIQFQE